MLQPLVEFDASNDLPSRAEVPESPFDDQPIHLSADVLPHQIEAVLLPEPPRVQIRQIPPHLVGVGDSGREDEVGVKVMVIALPPLQNIIHFHLERLSRFI
eukprot:CAMPEP_0180248412 /NCGR_PEP_ID=MMETSP0987-20121128/36707_1 /TAXON_ID=697907 /ORGANISM="non described non described, Strain CCMP2293" /LENGTH=100 /DNA_ID=CAMNT_0022216519 /DNA_START=44 /DNA_END=346 /DNA_ORIENTATION=+